jgi:hypothetical protein
VIILKFFSHTGEMMARRNRNRPTVEDIRSKINAELGTRPLDEGDWFVLLEFDFIKDIQDHDGPIGPVVELIRKIRLAREHPNKPQREDTPQLVSKEDAKMHLDRSRALSLLLYENASKDAGVRAFRSEVLNNTLLDREGVDGWIKQQAEVDGEATVWLKEIPIPREQKAAVLKWLSRRQDCQALNIELPASFIGWSIGSHVVRYGASGEWANAVATSLDGVLERLRNLSERLAGEYSWQEAQATIFVLTGNVPIVDPISVSHEMKRSPLSLSQRIVLDVDPTVSPLEVTNQYRLARRGMRDRGSGKLSSKHLRLATFVAERPEGESWAKKLAAWNRTERAEWGYGNDRRRFAHDCLQARRRLLGVTRREV